jgi:FPC/CPF motif-containing protein YcgG
MFKFVIVFGSPEASIGLESYKGRLWSELNPKIIIIIHKS